jgi:hypothetical protein
LVRARRELIHSSSWIVLSVKTCLFFVSLLAATAIGQESKKDAIDKQINALFENAKSGRTTARRSTILNAAPAVPGICRCATRDDADVS